MEIHGLLWYRRVLPGWLARSTRSRNGRSDESHRTGSSGPARSSASTACTQVQTQPPSATQLVWRTAAIVELDT
jgi:hypothetical protein